MAVYRLSFGLESIFNRLILRTPLLFCLVLPGVLPGVLLGVPRLGVTLARGRILIGLGVATFVGRAGFAFTLLRSRPSGVVVSIGVLFSSSSSSLTWSRRLFLLVIPCGTEGMLGTALDPGGTPVLCTCRIEAAGSFLMVGLAVDLGGSFSFVFAGADGLEIDGYRDGRDG